jgi:GT2 family glycosyltransferase
VAFVDDDVRVDPFWLQALARAFNEHPSVASVTGLVAAQSLVGAEQLYFDSRVSWATDLEPRVYHPTSDDPLHPWAAGRFGAGANMAFRLDAIRALGGFDENLGPGTKAMGGEDIDLFVRTLRSGGDLMYEPAALVWHVHRSTRADLERQLFGYGVGLTAYLLKQALHRQVALEMARKLPRATRHILAVTRVPQTNGVAARSARRYRLIELTGMALGPLYYLQSRFAGRVRRSVR